MEIHASEFIGKRIYASEAAIEGDAYAGAQPDWEDIGEINDVILSRDGNVEAVLVDVGGFLGIGERRIAIDMASVRFVADDATAEDLSDYFLVMQAPRAAFEEAPAYAWPHDAAMAVDNAAENTAEAAANTAEAAGEAATDTAEAAADTAAAAGEAATDTAEAAGEAAADTAEAAADTAAAAGEQAAEASENAAAAAREPIVRDGYAAPAAEDLNTEMLTGAKVYDANDEWIGEVSELLITTDGKITDAIVDVGGFLGIGEKPVQLNIGDIDILRKDDGSDLRVYVGMTKEQLEALPTYDK